MPNDVNIRHHRTTESESRKMAPIIPTREKAKQLAAEKRRLSSKPKVENENTARLSSVRAVKITSMNDKTKKEKDKEKTQHIIKWVTDVNEARNASLSTQQWNQPLD